MAEPTLEEETNGQMAQYVLTFESIIEVTATLVGTVDTEYHLTLPFSQFAAQFVGSSPSHDVAIVSSLAQPQFLSPLPLPSLPIPSA